MTLQASANRQERRRQETHQRILDGAIELFGRRGALATRIDDICEHVDIAQKTFYNHFPTKQHLFRELADVFMERVRALIDRARQHPATTGERLVFLFRRTAEIARGRGPKHRELLHEIAREAAAADAGATGLEAPFRQLLEEGVRRGDVTTEFDVAYLTEVVCATFFAVVTSWTLREDYDLTEHLEGTARILSEIIAPRGKA